MQKLWVQFMIYGWGRGERKTYISSDNEKRKSLVVRSNINTIIKLFNVTVISLHIFCVYRNMFPFFWTPNKL